MVKHARKENTQNRYIDYKIENFLFLYIKVKTKSNMGAGSSAFNQRDITIDFPEEIMQEFLRIKQTYFLREDGTFQVDTTSLNCRAIPDALNYIHYYDYSDVKRYRIYTIVYDIITNCELNIIQKNTNK